MIMENKDIKVITSINNNLIKEFYKLKEKKYRMINKEFLIEGEHLINEAYHANRLKILLSNNDDILNKYQVREKYKVSEDIIKKLSHTTSPQGIIGICDIKEIAVDYNKYQHILILDDVKDPGNIGTLIRTALAFNIDLIVTSKDSCDIYNDKVVRASQGAIFNIDVIYKDLNLEIDLMKKNKIKIISTSLSATTSVKDIEKFDKYAIILGNEANGVHKDIQDLADINVIIPISKEMESLNVAIAGAIMMYEVRK